MAPKVQYCLHTFVSTQYLPVPLRTSQCFSRTAYQIFELSLHGDDKIISPPLPGSLNNVFPILLVVRTLKTHPLHWVHQQGAIPRPTQQCRELLPRQEVVEYEWSGFPDTGLLPQSQMSLFIHSI